MNRPKTIASLNKRERARYLAASTSCKPKARWIDMSQSNAGRGTF